jgi:hypothetical protein
VPPFPEPSFAYAYDPAVEIAALRGWRREAPGRRIPAKRADRLLVATWNVVNLGLQARTDADHSLIAEILRWLLEHASDRTRRRIDNPPTRPRTGKWAWWL